MLKDLLEHFQSIDSDTVNAYKYVMPDKLSVSIHTDPTNMYVAKIFVGDDKQPYMTQGATGQELIEMVNDLMYSVVDIPQKYRPYMPSFFPPEDVRKALRLEVPKQFLNTRFEFAKS